MVKRVRLRTDRDRRGRFAKGNKLGGANTLAGRAAQIRAILLKRMTDEKAGKLADRLIKMATGGNLAAIKELFDRTMGKAAQHELSNVLRPWRRRN